MVGSPGVGTQSKHTEMQEPEDNAAAERSFGAASSVRTRDTQLDKTPDEAGLGGLSSGPRLRTPRTQARCDDLSYHIT